MMLTTIDSRQRTRRRAGGVPGAPKLLIVSATFPPRGGSGVQRVFYQAEWFAKAGVPVWVVTESADRTWVSDPTLRPSHLPPERIVRIPQYPTTLLRGAAQLLKKTTGCTLYPDEHAAWWRPALRAAAARVQTNQISVVLCSLGQPSALRVGYHVKRRFPHLKLIVDTRDLWAGNPVSFRGRRSRLVSPLDERFEARWLSAADAIVTVSRHHAAVIRDRYPAFEAERIQVVPNGFDESLFLAATPEPGPAPVTIRYTGFLVPEQRPETLFEALRQFRGEDERRLSDVRVEFYGGNPGYVAQLAAEAGVSDLVTANGYVDHRRAVSLMLGADVLLLFWTSDPGCMCGKFYEYLRSDRYILAFDQGNREARELLEQKRRGRWVSACDLSAIKDALRDLIQKRRRGKSLLYEDLPSVAEFSREAQAATLRKLIEFLDVGMAKGEPSPESEQRSAIVED